MNHSLLLTIAKYSIWEAVRDKFLLLIFAGVFGFFLISLFIGELAITESSETQAAMLASVLRLFSVFTVGLFVITSMVREFNDKGFELILSHPVPRVSYYFGKFAGFSCVALLISFLCCCCLSFYVSPSLAFIWSFSLFCELLIIISLSFLCLFSFSNITISFSIVIGFYILSRSMEAIQLISSSPIIGIGSIDHIFMNELLNAIAYVIPDLYRFTLTEWLIYDVEIIDSISHVIGQTLIYIAFISFVALFDLYRKEL